MERGINLGGAFDRRDGQRGWEVGPEVLDEIAAAGFSGVRLPVRWANARLAEFVEVIEAARARGLAVVLTNHHDDEAMADPRFRALTVTEFNPSHGAADGSTTRRLVEVLARALS